MSDQPSNPPAPPAKRRSREEAPAGPWPVAASLQILERYGISTLALIALAWFTATTLINPLVKTAQSSMESVAEKVGKIEEIFKASERINREHSIRATTAIEGIKTEISIHRQQAVEMRDGLLAKILAAQEREFSQHQSDMERILRDALIQGGVECDFPPGVKGIVGNESDKPGGG